MLVARLTELDAVVDFFVIAESTTTFRGGANEPLVDVASPLLTRWKDKIRYVLVEDMPDSGAWAREHHQRRALSRGLYDVEPEDLVLLSDLDEIPCPQAVSRLRRSLPKEPTTLVQDFYYYDTETVRPNSPWCGTVAFSGATAGSLDPSGHKGCKKRDDRKDRERRVALLVLRRGGRSPRQDQELLSYRDSSAYRRGSYQAS